MITIDLMNPLIWMGTTWFLLGVWLLHMVDNVPGTGSTFRVLFGAAFVMLLSPLFMMLIGIVMVAYVVGLFMKSPIGKFLHLPYFLGRNPIITDRGGKYWRIYNLIAFRSHMLAWVDVVAEDEEA